MGGSGGGGGGGEMGRAHNGALYIEEGYQGNRSTTLAVIYGTRTGGNGHKLKQTYRQSLRKKFHHEDSQRVEEVAQSCCAVYPLCF